MPKRVETPGPETVLRPMQASLFTPPLHTTQTFGTWKPRKKWILRVMEAAV